MKAVIKRFETNQPTAEDLVQYEELFGKFKQGSYSRKAQPDIFMTMGRGFRKESLASVLKSAVEQSHERTAIESFLVVCPSPPFFFRQ